MYRADIFGSKFIYIHGIQRHHWAFASYSLYRSQIARESPLPARKWKRQGPGDCPPHELMLHLIAGHGRQQQQCFPDNDNEQYLWFYAHVRRSTRIFVLPALHRYHVCPGHVYLYLRLCYFKVSSAMTHIAPIHENINNWSPPVEYAALYVASWRGLFSWDI